MNDAAWFCFVLSWSKTSDMSQALSVVEDHQLVASRKSYRLPLNRVLCQLTLLTRFGQCFLQALSSSLYARKIHRTCHPRYFLRDWPGSVNFRISESLCNSGDLGVSVVNLSRESLTTETPRTTEHSERNANLLGHRLAWPWPAILSEGGMIPGSPS